MSQNGEEPLFWRRRYTARPAMRLPRRHSTRILLRLLHSSVRCAAPVDLLGVCRRRQRRDGWPSMAAKKIARRKTRMPHAAGQLTDF